MSGTTYAVAPGEYLDEWATNNNVGLLGLADLLRCPLGHVVDFLAGRVPVTDVFAADLHRVTGIPVAAWLRYEAAYRADLARLGKVAP